MLSVDGNGRTVDPEDSVKLREWTQNRSAKQQQLTAAGRQVATLQAVLDRPDVVAAKREETEAGQALTRAAGAATTAQQEHDLADAAAKRFEANELAAAIATLDEATNAVSRTLAELLKESTVSAALTATVDGLALRERYRAATAGVPPRWDHTTIPFPATPAEVIDPQLALPTVDPADGTDYGRLLAVLDRLDDRVDAVADLVTAESVHQLVQGNATRSGATLAVAAEGRVPDEFYIIRTPRPGSDITHRLAILLDPARPAAWTTLDPGPAARLDPITDTWATRLLPNPAEVRTRVHWVAADGTPAADPTDLPAADLALDALGWVRVAANTAELTHRLALAAQRQWRAAHNGSAPPGRPTWDATSPTLPGRASLADLITAAAALGRLLAATRAADPSDLMHPTSTVAVPPAATAVAAAANRVRAAEEHTTDLGTRLEEAATALDPPAPSHSAPEPPDIHAVLDLLLAAAAAGVAEAVPPGDSPADPTLLAALARAAAARLRQRTAAAPFTADPQDPAGSLARARARADQLAGMRLPMPVEFTFPGEATQAADLAAGATRLAGAPPAGVRSWLRDHARVMPAVRALADALDVAAAVNAAEVTDLRVTQLPTRTDDVWAGSIATPQPGTLSVVVQAGYGSTLPDTIGGLVLETWSQPVPADMHDSGVAVSYDQPNATPPQALLLAVHPTTGGAGQPPSWDLDTLLDVVTSTLALARDRAVAAERHVVRGIEVDDD